MFLKIDKCGYSFWLHYIMAMCVSKVARSSRPKPRGCFMDYITDRNANAGFQYYLQFSSKTTDIARTCSILLCFP